MTEREARARFVQLLLASGYRPDANGNYSVDGGGWDFAVEELDADTRARVRRHIQKSIRRMWFQSMHGGAEVDQLEIRRLAEALGFLDCFDTVVPEWNEEDRW